MVNGKKLLALVLPVFLCSTLVKAEWIYDLDPTIIDTPKNNYVTKERYKTSVVEDKMIPTVQECMQWDIDYVEIDKPIPTNINDINQKMLKHLDRYFPHYNLISVIAAFNLAIDDPGHNYKIITNYPVNERKYKWLNMDLDYMDFEDIVKGVYYDKFDVDLWNGLIKSNVSFFYDWTPEIFNHPLILQEYGLLPDGIPHKDYQYTGFYEWENSHLDEYVIYYLDNKNKTAPLDNYIETQELAKKELKESKLPSKIWRHASYSSRWCFSDLINGLAGDTDRHQHPEYNDNDDIYDGIMLIPQLESLWSNTTADTIGDIDAVLKYQDFIINLSDSDYRYTGQNRYWKLKKYLEKEYGLEVDNTTWKYTVAYLITSKGVRRYYGD